MQGEGSLPRGRWQRPIHPLKQLARQRRVRVYDVADALGIGHQELSVLLNQPPDWEDHVRRAIEELATKREQERASVTD